MTSSYKKSRSVCNWGDSLFHCVKSDTELYGRKREVTGFRNPVKAAYCCCLFLFCHLIRSTTRTV